MLSPSSTASSDCALREACALASACVPARPSPCEGIEERHSAKLALCDLLEAIADSLPLAIDRRVVLRVSETLVPVVREAHRFEEELVFPAYGRTASRLGSLRRLQGEHVEDEALAEELTEVLLRIGHGGEVGNAEALGFMLRTFFETMRRHIAFEREHVVPLIRDEIAGER